MIRIDRANDFERQCTIECNFIETAYSSCLISIGKTKVLCTCSVEKTVPAFRKESNSGWLTAEYAMLPGSTATRKNRDGIKKDGRSVEIQRLIGRSLRQAINLDILGPITLTIDCDVLQADGGTRTTSITGAYVALVLAVDRLLKEGIITQNPLTNQIAAISAGVLNNDILVDLCYEEDSNIGADINLVMNNASEIIEIQGTGEQCAIGYDTLNKVIHKARLAILRLMNKQREALKNAGVTLLPKQIFVVASSNAHKVQEMNALLGEDFQLYDMKSLGFDKEIIEDGLTFQANSIIKAKEVFQALHISTIADDSGLCVEALNGVPGIYSARYGGNINQVEKNDMLLNELKDSKNRNAYFACNITLVDQDGDISFEAKCNGSILKEPVGNNGFGYDPIFCYEDGRPLATMLESEKNEISHRGLALKKFKAYVTR